MKKKLYGISWLVWLIPVFLSVIGILIGTFYDKAISDNIVNVNSGFGGFFETVGESFAYGIIAIGGMLSFLGLFPREKAIHKILGLILLIASLSIAIWHLGSSMVKNQDNYGLTFDTATAYGLATLLMVIYAFLAVFFFDHHDLDLTLKYGLIILICMLVQFALMTLLKKIGCRPRYRFLIDGTRNMEGIVFRSWYEFRPFQYHGDYFKSWPSGHTATATTTILLAVLSPIYRFHWKGDNYTFYVLGLVYTLIVAFSRILCGAHFLSDVSFALFITSLEILLVLVVSEKMKKKVQKANEN